MPWKDKKPELCFFSFKISPDIVWPNHRVPSDMVLPIVVSSTPVDINGTWLQSEFQFNVGCGTNMLASTGDVI
jgi:hypothetical protein